MHQIETLEVSVCFAQLVNVLKRQRLAVRNVARDYLDDLWLVKELQEDARCQEARVQLDGVKVREFDKVGSGQQDLNQFAKLKNANLSVKI